MLMLMVLPQVESGLEDEDPWATEEKVAIIVRDDIQNKIKDFLNVVKNSRNFVDSSSIHVSRCGS